jgi:hypothetical protein
MEMEVAIEIETEISRVGRRERRQESEGRKKVKGGPLVNLSMFWLGSPELPETNSNPKQNRRPISTE